MVGRSFYRSLTKDNNLAAEYRSRLSNSEARTNLGEIAPLSSPFVLIVDPASHCNLKCRFCPTGHPKLIEQTGRYQGAMPFETFKKIVDDLEDFSSPIKVLRLYKEGEPLMNKNFAEMIRYGKQSKKVMRIDTTTNGVLLTPNNSEKIIDAGINQINISVNGLKEEQFQELVRTKVNFDRYVKNIEYLFSIKGECTIYVKAIQENLTAEDQKRFIDIFGNISDRIFFEHLFPNWPGFTDDIIPKDGKVALYGGEVKEQSVCPYIFYTTTINSDGTVSLCIQDWARTLVVGDVKNQSLRDIWLGQLINTHRMAHLEGLRKANKTCGDCGVMKYSVYDNLDNQSEEIKKRLGSGHYF